MKNIKNTKQISYEIFYFLSTSLVVFLLLEVVFPNMVLAYLNVNIIVVLFLLNLFFILIFNNFSFKNQDDKQ